MTIILQLDRRTTVRVGNDYALQKWRDKYPDLKIVGKVRKQSGTTEAILSLKVGECTTTEIDASKMASLRVTVSDLGKKHDRRFKVSKPRKSTTATITRKR